MATVKLSEFLSMSNRDYLYLRDTEKDKKLVYYQTRLDNIVEKSTLNSTTTYFTLIHLLESLCEKETYDRFLMNKRNKNMDGYILGNIFNFFRYNSRNKSMIPDIYKNVTIADLNTLIYDYDFKSNPKNFNFSFDNINLIKDIIASSSKFAIKVKYNYKKVDTNNILEFLKEQLEIFLEDAEYFLIVKPNEGKRDE